MPQGRLKIHLKYVEIPGEGWGGGGGGGKKMDVLNRGGWFKNAMAHLTLSLKYFINKYTLQESTSLDYSGFAV